MVVAVEEVRDGPAEAALAVAVAVAVAEGMAPLREE
jgi:hypothetical protein